jgi:hypothetical protein
VIEYPGPCQLLLLLGLGLLPGCGSPTGVSRAADCWPGGRKVGCGPPCCCCCSKGDAGALLLLLLLLAGTASGCSAAKLSGSEGRRPAAVLTAASLLLLAALLKVSPGLCLSLPFAYTASCRGDQNLMLDALAVTMVSPCRTGPRGEVSTAGMHSGQTVLRQLHHEQEPHLGRKKSHML